MLKGQTMDILEKIQKASLKKGIPVFRAGDTVRVHCKIREGEKERIQAFEGVCISRHRSGIRSSFSVRKISYGVGVERVFPLHSPLIDRIEVLSFGKVRRARLFYLRKLSGKAARIEGRLWEGNEAETATAEAALPEADAAGK